MYVINFKLISEFQTIHRRPFELDVPGILDPNDVRPLVDGEFLALTATTYKMKREGDNSAGTADPGAGPSFAYFAERGRYEVQAIAKGPFLYLGQYEADTKIMDSTGAAVGDALEVVDIDIGGIVRRGLKKATSGYKVGYVTRLPANNNGWLRFIRYY
jgi:hypothetical protein